MDEDDFKKDMDVLSVDISFLEVPDLAWEGDRHVVDLHQRQLTVDLL